MLKDKRKDPRKPKQAAVIRAAAELFVQYGYDGTSTEMIAERAGVSRQTIYNQFEGKEALFLAIASDLVEEIFASLGEEVEGPGDLRGTLFSFAHNLLAKMLRPKTIAFHRVVVTEAARFPGLARAVHDAISTAVEDKVAVCLDKQSQLTLPDPKLAARQFMALIIHPYPFKALLGVGEHTDGPEIQRHLEAAVDTFVRAYGRDEDGVSPANRPCPAKHCG
jgi:TetR/AcrR family transcriptional repressor of mexJK operon